MPRLAHLLLLLALLLGGHPARAQGGRPMPIPPLPPALQHLLPPPLPYGDAADIARLQEARPQWPADSLSRLLIYSRLGQEFGYVRQPDSATYYLRRAWRLAYPSFQHRQPAEVVMLARDLADYHYARGTYDSTRYYFQLAARLFHAAGFDSSHHVNATSMLPSNHLWTEGGIQAGSLASAGSASRALGDLPGALAYYERAMTLYQQQRELSGLLWVQSLLGETYAEQDNYPQAVAAYEQALATARRYLRQLPTKSSHALAELVLSYYTPLLLARPGQEARASQLAAEATRALRAAYPPEQLRDNPTNALKMAQLSLVPAQAALQAGQRAAAASWLATARSWLRYGLRPNVATPGAADLPYIRVQTLALALQAWQQHPTDPAGARHLLAEATGLVAQASPADPLRSQRQQLARYCLAMHEPGPVAALLRPLLRGYQQSGSTLPLSRITDLLTQAYAQAARYDSAYVFAHRTQGLTDTLRQARQFGALAVTEARFRTREQASQIRLLTLLSSQQLRAARLAAAGAGLLAVLALAAGLGWRTARRLNQQLAAQADQLLAQATRLGELDAAKNQFFANVSHELRTPLTLVMGPLDSLLTDPPRPLPAAVRQPVALAFRHAQRLQELVTRILDLTKLQAGRLELHPAPTAPAALLRRVVAQFESLAAERRVALVGPANLPHSQRVLIDGEKVEEILTNLLINALNHTPPGGAVTVTAALSAPDGQFALTVRDTGPGIAQAEQERVFERYYQSPQGQAQGGTGLGLALSRELATLLGGTLTLVSEPDQGAAFTLRLPAPHLPDNDASPDEALAPVPLPPTLWPAPAVSAVSQLRVLVVEDQADLRDYLHQLLTPTYEVLTADDGQAALELLAHEGPVELLLTDAMMPRLSGTELLARLRADPAWQGLPVLMLTARADEAHRLAALTVGVDDYLTKPFLPAELLARVRALLARQAVRRQFAALPPAGPEPEAESPAEAAAATSPTTTAASPLAEAAPPAGLAAARNAPEIELLPLADAAGLLSQWQLQAIPYLADPGFGPAELAGLLCLSERTLYRRLGEQAGLTPAAWLRELRLDQARRLLEAGNYGSVTTVAEAVGFVTAKSFSQRYIERFGRRPSDYPA